MDGQTDGQTDRRTGDGIQRTIAYMLSHANNCQIAFGTEPADEDRSKTFVATDVHHDLQHGLYVLCVCYICSHIIMWQNDIL